MAVQLYREPELEKPMMFVGWPGIGNIGILAVNMLKSFVNAEEFGEIESWDFFYPKRVLISGGILKELEFPTNRFYYRRLAQQDVIFFIGEEQPTEGGRIYASGEKAFRLANLVVDVALRFSCRRIYTSGACISLIHHQVKPRVCAVVSSKKCVSEIRRFPNTIVMSDLGGRSEDEGMITGLNGLLLAVAKKRGLEGMCLMGEIPDWLSMLSLPYPKASKSVLEVFSTLLGLPTNFVDLDPMIQQVDAMVEGFYAKFPKEMKEEYDHRKSETRAKPGTVTIQARVYIDEQFKKEGEEGGEGFS